jgi:hypothetical protein
MHQNKKPIRSELVKYKVTCSKYSRLTRLHISSTWLRTVFSSMASPSLQGRLSSSRKRQDFIKICAEH